MVIPARKTKPLRALVVEDSSDDALLLARELRRGGYEPVCERVETAEAMEKALASSSWDVILSDYEMPRFGAPEALSLAHKVGSDAPFIVVSGKVGEAAAFELVKAGAHDYVMKDNLARLCLSVERSVEDADERRRAEKELQRRDAILEAVRFAADRFLGEAGARPENMSVVLRRLGEATGVSRVYIFENYAGEDGEVWGRRSYEWVAEGVAPQIDNPALEALPYRAAGLGRWMASLERGEPVHGRVRDLIGGAGSGAERRGTLSLAVVPIFVEGGWWGFIGFDDCEREREWSVAEVGALSAAASTLGAAIRGRKVEEDLRQSEERYRAVIEQATDAIFLLDAETGYVVEANAAFQKLFEYTADELQSIKIYDLVAHPRENIDATIRRTLSERRRVVGGRKYRRKDGSLVDVEVGVSVISLGGRDVICTIVRDVTERKENEERLRISEAGLADAQRVAHLGNWEWDFVSNEARWSDELYRIHGLTPQDPILSWEEFLRCVHPADRERVEKSFHEALHERKPYDIEHRILRPDGTERVVHCQLEVSFDESGRAVRAVGTVHDITERKRSEEKLRASEAELRAVLGAINDVILVLDGEGRHLEIAPTNTALRRRPPADVIGKTLHETLPKEVADKILGHVRHALDARESVDMEHSVELGGRMRWFSTTISPMLDDTVVAVARDITGRKRDEDALRESEERFKVLAEAIFEGVGIHHDGRIVETNAAFAPMLGYEPSEIIGVNPMDIVAPEYRDVVRKAVSSGLEEPYEAVLLRKDGTTFDAEVRGKTTVYKGHAARVSAIRDITERKKNEEALRQSERLYRTVISQATENIFLVDVETRRIVESNPAIRESLGYSEGELHRMTLYDVVAASRESVDENIRVVVEGRNPFVGERKYRRKDGTLLDVEVSASTILLGGRETLCAVAHDVTERARAQRLLEERVATLSSIASSLTLDAPVEETLRSLAESVMAASTATTYLVMLADEETGGVRLVGSYGVPEGYDEGLQAAFEAGVDSPVHEAILTNRPVMFRDAHRIVLGDPLYEPIHPFAEDIPEDAIYILPLVFRGRAIGAIAFGYLPEREPSEDEKTFLKVVADQTAVAVENARLFSEARGKAALEERQRLARDLHDSVSQALYGIVLGARTARESVPHEPEGAVEPLEYVLSLARAGLAEMRSLIFELMPETLEKEGLVAALEKQADAMEARHGVTTRTVLCDEPEASPKVKEAAYRIVQEALHNTAKHARAEKAEIHMECALGFMKIEVVDDGMGFDLESDFPGHLGLESMRERVSRLGGTLEIESGEGRGTRIFARIPTA